jgi:hypothetical protein
MKRIVLIIAVLFSVTVFAQNESEFAPVATQSGFFTTYWMTYAGSTDTDELMCVRDMPDKGVVVCGRTMSTNFPGTDSLDTLAGQYDMVIFRMDSLGQILWTTLYGGQFYESASALVVHDTSIFVVGVTNGNDCPMINAYQSAPMGSYETLILRLGFDGTIQQSSYFGSIGAETGYGIDVDSTGLIVIGGATTSPSLPMSSLGYQQSNAGANDCFISVLNSAFAPQWTTFYGGSSTEDVHTVIVTPLNQITVCGGSFSTDFPCTPNAFQSSRLGNGDAYYAVFGMDGSRKYATYYGGTGGEDCFGLAGDENGNIYLAGHTSSVDFNTAGTIFQPNYQGVNDAWVARFDSVGVPYFSTYFGGAVDDKTWSMFRKDGYLYVTGVSTSPDLPMYDVLAPQDSMWGNGDGFIVKFDTAGNYVTSSYFGGSGADDMMSVTVNDDTVATCVGVSYSNNLPVLNAYQSTYVASGDGFAVRYKLSETWSSNAVIQNSEFNNAIKVYPNPADETVFLTCETRIEKCYMTSMTGELVVPDAQVSESRVSFNTSSLNPGMYFVHVQTFSGTVTEKVIVR